MPQSRHCRGSTLLAAVIVAEIDDVSRFNRPQPLGSWAGLTQRHRESDLKVSRGHVTIQGSPILRWHWSRLSSEFPRLRRSARSGHHPPRHRLSGAPSCPTSDPARPQSPRNRRKAGSKCRNVTTRRELAGAAASCMKAYPSISSTAKEDGQPSGRSGQRTLPSRMPTRKSSNPPWKCQKFPFSITIVHFSGSGSVSHMQ
ncbi:hypothetical protein E1284_25575 [Actinomadura bangladeshensis]|uniref:Transposase IS116/IS110/IS902 C-terminal domain-containing protein n=1 Tax=Actinomadura bangladeshensis TaxID=453573 RepID=A0A4R4NX32_9ACTN|nr:hypothetical protein E1284_25575 [Actinomadura bangladeshensis]